MKIISHPILRLGSHSFIAPFYILVFAPNICLSAALYKHIRAQDISGVSAVKNISHPIIHLGSHSFSLPLYMLEFAPNICLGATIYTGTALNTCHMFWLPKIIPHPILRLGSHSFIEPFLHTSIRGQNLPFGDYIQVSALNSSRAFRL